MIFISLSLNAMRSRRTQAAPSSKHSEEFFFHNVTFFFALFPQGPRNNLTSSEWQQQSRGEARETNLQLTFHNYQVFLFFYFKDSVCRNNVYNKHLWLPKFAHPCTVSGKASYVYGGKEKKKFSCVWTQSCTCMWNHANGSPHIRAGVKMPSPLIMADDSDLLFTSCIFF